LKKIFLILGFCLFFTKGWSVNLKPNEAFLKCTGRTPSMENTIKDDMEFRIGAKKIDLYSSYFLYERENYFDSNEKEWFIGYGAVIQLLNTNTDLMSNSKLKMQVELFDRHRYNSNSQSYRTFLETTYKKALFKYGFSMVGKDYENFQPAAYFGINYKRFMCDFEIDKTNRIISAEQFKPVIPFNKTSGIEFMIGHRKVDRDFYKVEAMIYYKKQ
jgi:hypothetical protein